MLVYTLIVLKAALNISLGLITVEAQCRFSSDRLDEFCSFIYVNIWESWFCCAAIHRGKNRVLVLL